MQGWSTTGVPGPMAPLLPRVCCSYQFATRFHSLATLLLHEPTLGNCPANSPRSQAIRAGKTSKFVHSVYISEFRDPQGFPVVANITGVQTNQAETGCLCTPTPTNKCTCTPDAQIMQGGRFIRVFPILGPNPSRTQPQSLGGRVYRIHFKGISLQTGLSCTGYAELCVVRRPARVKPRSAPPSCDAFDSTATVRDATVCNNRRALGEGDALTADEGPAPAAVAALVDVAPVVPAGVGPAPTDAPATDAGPPVPAVSLPPPASAPAAAEPETDTRN
jgi:hypothetical protein